MSQSEENAKFAADAAGAPALLPPPVKPAKSVLRSIEALGAAEAQGSGAQARRSEAPIIDAVAAESEKSPQPAARKPAEPVSPLRASAFRPNVGAEPLRPSRRNGWLLRAAGVAVLLGAGWIAAAQVASGQLPFLGASAPAVARLSPIEQLRQDLQQVSGDLAAVRAHLAKLDSAGQRARQTAELDALKKSLADISRRIEQGRNAQTAAVAELGARLERARTDEAKQREEFSERIARLERQSSDGRPTATQAVQPPNSTVVPRVAAAPPPPALEAGAARRPAGLAGYVLREVYNGVALIEGRNGYMEVYPGAFVPGAGRVQRIARRSGEWVVVTSNGVIGRRME